MPYTWANQTYGTSSTWANQTYGTSSTTFWTYPSGPVTAGLITAGSVSLPAWNCSSNSSLLPDGWNWGWLACDSPWTWTRYPETAAQLADRERRQDEAIRQAEERKARLQVADARAHVLLLSLLDPVQAASYTQRGWFDVTGSAGGRFRINKRGQAGNIDELPPDSNDRIASYCIHPSGGFPDADAHVAQYLALITDEPGFRRAANRTPRRRLQAA